MIQKKPAPPNHSSVKLKEKNINSPQENSKFVAQIRHAPLPDPQELREYKNIDKSLPNRIVKMAEKEQKFRHIATYFGQMNFIILVAGGYGLAAYTGINGAQWTGAAIAAGVSYVAYVFKSKNPKPPKIQNTNPPNTP